MTRISIVLSACLLAAASASAQPVVTKPTAVDFTAATDHNNTTAAGVPLITYYELATSTTFGIPLFVKSIGKPTPGAAGVPCTAPAPCIHVVVPEFVTMPVPGVQYLVTITSVGPTGRNMATSENIIMVGNGPPPPRPPAPTSTIAIVQPTQTTFPRAVKACWTPNAASDNVTRYAITLDGGIPITAGPTVTADPDCPGKILAPVTIPTFGLHTFSLVAVNAIGTSTPPSTLTQDFPAPPPPVCSHSVSPTSVSAPAAGITGQLTITTAAGCNSHGTSQVSWLTLTGEDWTGPATVTYTVAPNAAAIARTGTMTVAGKVVTVTQAGVQPPQTCQDPLATNFGGPLPCTYPPPTTNVTGSVTVTACTLRLASKSPYTGGGGVVQLYRNPGVTHGSAITTPDAAGVYTRSVSVSAGTYKAFAVWTKSGQPTITSPVVAFLCVAQP